MKTAYGLPKKREEVVNELQAAYTQGNLDDHEYERRLGQVYEATSLEDLKDIVEDFPDLIKFKLFPSKQERVQNARPNISRPPIPPQHAARPSHRAPRPTDAIRVIMREQHMQLPVLGEEPLFFSCFLGSLEVDAVRSMVQSEVCNLHVECFLGNTRINLLNPDFEGKHVQIYIHGALGEVEILVPKGVKVSKHLRMYLGEFSLKNKNPRDLLGGLFKSKRAEPPSDVPFTLTLYGEFYFGSVKVVHRAIGR